MFNIQDYVVEAVKANALWECMGWDEKHGPTQEQVEAFRVLFPDIWTGPSTAEVEKMLGL